MLSSGVCQPRFCGGLMSSDITVHTSLVTPFQKWFPAHEMMSEGPMVTHSPTPKPEAEGPSLLCSPVRKERCWITEPAAPFPAQPRRLSSVPFSNVPISSSPNSRTFLVILSSTYMQSRSFSRKISYSSRRFRKCIHAYVPENSPPPPRTELWKPFLRTQFSTMVSPIFLSRRLAS